MWLRHLQRAGTVNELAVVDQHVAGWQSLAADLYQQGLTVLVLNPDLDGISQVSQELTAHPGFTAVQFLSHGDADGFQLGSSWIDQGDVESYQNLMRSWRTELAPDADLLFYECDLAAANPGQALLASIHTFTGANIAASTHLVGSAAMGGSWVLDYQIGSIDAQSPLKQPPTNWSGVLAITANGTVASAITASGVTSLTFTATVAAGTNTYMVVEVADQNLGAGVSSVTYDGTALTSIGTESGNEVVALYGLKAPATGSYSVVVTFEASTYAAARRDDLQRSEPDHTPADFTGVSGNGKTSSIAATSAVNDLELDVTYWNSDPSGYSAGGSQTQQWEQSDSNLLGVSTTAAGAASVTMSSTVSTSENYQQAAVALQPAALTASTTTLSPSTTTPTYGTSVTFTATVTGSGGTPTGTVTSTMAGPLLERELYQVEAPHSQRAPSTSVRIQLQQTTVETVPSTRAHPRLTLLRLALRR